MSSARVARATRILIGVGVGGLVFAGAGCSSSTPSNPAIPSGTAPTTPARPTSSTPPSVPPTTAVSSTPAAVPSTSARPTPVTSTPKPSAPPRTTAPPSTTAAPPPRVTSSATPVSPSTCRSVGVRVIEGGAVRGAEIAALQFTNTGTSSCRLGGFPEVVLLLGGRRVGSPSQPGPSTPRTLTLRPGDTVESVLRDFSSCQAPLSDAARVTVPGETKTVVRPIQLRACTLRVGPLGPPA